MALTRMWINAPSTHHPEHPLHGRHVLCDPDHLPGSQLVRCWFVEGPVSSCMVFRNALSNGWPDPYRPGERWTNIWPYREGWYWHTYQLSRPKSGRMWSLPRCTKITKRHLEGWHPEPCMQGMPRESTLWMGPLEHPPLPVGGSNA